MEEDRDRSRRALIIEDEAPIREVLVRLLSDAGIQARGAADGREGLDAVLGDRSLDVVLLDLMLPGINGLELLLELHARGIHTPVIVISAHLSDSLRYDVLAAGAMSTLEKPFLADELLLWVERAIDASRSARRPEIQVLGDITLDLHQLRAIQDGESLPLTSREFRLLRLLGEQPGATVPALSLASAIWAPLPPKFRQLLTQCVSRLRNKLDRPGASSYIEEVYGEGYRFVAPTPVAGERPPRSTVGNPQPRAP